MVLWVRSPGTVDWVLTQDLTRLKSSYHPRAVVLIWVEVLFSTRVDGRIHFLLALSSAPIQLLGASSLSSSNVSVCFLPGQKSKKALPLVTGQR